MANRAVDRARSLVIVALAALAIGADAPASRPAWERRPYAIRAFVAFDPAARLDGASQAAARDAWLDLARRFVGAPWALEVRPAEGALAVAPLDALTPADVLPVAAGADKAWVIRVGSDGRSGAVLAGRDLDVATGRLGPLRTREAPDRADLPRALLHFSLDLFTPTAEVLATLGNVVQLSVQGAALTPADPAGRVVAPGGTFVAVRLFEATAKRPAQAVPVPWTYLTVEEVDGPVARCELLSALRDPLSKRVAGVYRLLAVGARPAPIPTRVRFVTRPPNSVPAAGYSLAVRQRKDGPERPAGTTDREGRVVLPPGAADRPLIARLLGGGVEPLVEFPILPGETADERVLRIDPLERTVALESRLDALRDELVDVIAKRARLEARIKARAEGNAWPEVKALLDEYRRLPSRKAYADRLAALREEAKREQEQAKVAVLTRTALARLDDTEGLIARYLDDEFAQAYADALRDAQSGGVLPPSADWKAFAPRGLGFRVLVPGTPRPVGEPVLPGADPDLVRTFAAEHEGRRYLVQSFGLTDAQLAGPEADLLADLDRRWDEYARARPGVRLQDRRVERRGEQAVTEFRLDGPLGLPDPQATQLRVRQVVDRAARRVTILGLAGPPGRLDGREGATFLNSFTPEAPAAEGAAPKAP
jgi:hypothetical protein